MTILPFHSTKRQFYPFIQKQLKKEMCTYCPLIVKPPPLGLPGPKSDLPSNKKYTNYKIKISQNHTGLK